MATLQEKVVSSYWLNQLKGTQKDILNSLIDEQQILPGLSVDGTNSVKTTLIRTTFANAFLHLVFFSGGKVFGGYLRDGLSGKMWNDLDIIWPDEKIKQRFYDVLPLNLSKYLLKECYEISVDQLKITHSYPLNDYSKKNTKFKITIDHNDIQYEFNTDNIFEPFKNSINHPISYGCMLTYDGFDFNNWFTKNSWITPACVGSDTETIVNLLKNGNDIIIILKENHFENLNSSSKKKYISYWNKTSKKILNKLNVIKIIGNKNIITDK